MLPEAQRAADAGDLVEAIKIVRQETGLGLKEAKDAVDAYLRTGGMKTGPSRSDMPASAVAALHEGDLISAIRHVREASGRGLKDSKEFVEAYLAANPLVQEQFREASKRRGGGLLGRLVFVAILIAAVIALLLALGKP